MPTVQYLKKKLKGIRSTQKLSKAMKTASTVKYSRISSAFSEFSRYEQCCNLLYQQYKADFDALFSANPNAPQALVVIAGNKGMCGNFNSELLSFAEQTIENSQNPYIVFLCGKQAEAYFTENKLPYEKSYVFSDVPSYQEANELMGDLEGQIAEGKISSVKIVFPRYSNMMKQTPFVCDLLGGDEEGMSHGDMLFIPDKESVIKGMGKKVLSACLFKRILETALGAQAATLMTMRSAYDTATEYVLQLESDINRKRQSQVTADVIETSAEFAQ